MKAEIISVGNELLLGHTINSDAALVAREMAALGIEVANMQVVGDNEKDILLALEQAAHRARIIITTGGLGPTEDDLTRETVAKFAEAPLALDEGCASRLKEYFGDRPMSANQLKQAWLPAGATAFDNPNGTAPGCAVPFGKDQFILLLPGPPRELAPMLENQVRPFLLSLTQRVIISTILRCFGIGEGAAAERLGALLGGENPVAATYAADGEMFVKITARAETGKEARQLIRPVADQCANLLGDFLYGIDVASLESAVVRQLTSDNMTVATAESCTGGLLAKRLTDQPGSSAIFRLGLVTYSNEAKMRLLGVPENILGKYGAVSPQTAYEMARRVRQIDGADLGIGISGIAGPDGGTPDKPVGLVYIALSSANGDWLRVMRPEGRYLGRDWVRNRAASHALDMVRRLLAKLPIAIK